MAADPHMTAVFEAHLDTPEEIEAVLARFEDRYAEMTGERLLSGAFYERYRRGEFDDPLGAAWSTYFESYLELSGVGRDLERVVPPRELAHC